MTQPDTIALQLAHAFIENYASGRMSWSDAQHCIAEELQRLTNLHAAEVEAHRVTREECRLHARNARAASVALNAEVEAHRVTREWYQQARNATDELLARVARLEMENASLSRFGANRQFVLRAEKAEARVTVLEGAVKVLTKEVTDSGHNEKAAMARAEQAEADLKLLGEEYALEEARAEKAEARLAELVREVIAWNSAGWSGVPLSLIVGKYESPEPAKPEPKCKVCGDVNSDTHGRECDRFEPEDDHG